MHGGLVMLWERVLVATKADEDAYLLWLLAKRGRKKASTGRAWDKTREVRQVAMDAWREAGYPMPVSAGKPGTRLRQSELSTRCFNVCIHAGLHTFEDAASIGAARFTKLKNAGPKTRREMSENLKEHGLAWADGHCMECDGRGQDYWSAGLGYVPCKACS